MTMKFFTYFRTLVVVLILYLVYVVESFKDTQKHQLLKEVG